MARESSASAADQWAADELPLILCTECGRAERGVAQIEARMEPREGVLLLPVAQGELGCELLC